MPRIHAALAAVGALAVLTAACGVPTPARSGGPTDSVLVDPNPVSTGQQPTDSVGPDVDPSSQVLPVGGEHDTYAARLAGKTFESTAITGHTVAAGTTLTLGFGVDRNNPNGWGLSAYAGCNHMGGSATWTGDTVRATDMAMTAMGCPEPLMSQDTWLAGLLADGVRIDWSGDTLTAQAGDVTITFIDSKVAHPDRPLVGTMWRLDGVTIGGGDDGMVASVPAGLVATMRIQDNILNVDDGAGYWYGQDPAGRAGLNATVDGSAVHVTSKRAPTDIACPREPVANNQTCIDMTVLQADFRVSIDQDRLTVTGVGANAGRGLVFVADDSLDATDG